MPSVAHKPYRIGGFNVCCYHNCTHAAAIHAELKKLHIDAAVVDHAFVFSPLQLAVALFRIESNPDFLFTPNSANAREQTVEEHEEQEQQQQQQQQQLQLQQKKKPRVEAEENSPVSPDSPAPLHVARTRPGRRLSYSRRIFAALSLSHNLDRILQILPPGPQTSSVVILYHSPCAPATTPHVSPVQPCPAQIPKSEETSTGEGMISAKEQEQQLAWTIAQTVANTNPDAEEHALSSIEEPFWLSDALPYGEMPKLMEFYNVSETMLMAAQHSLTRRDVRRVCAAAAAAATASGESMEKDEKQRRALRWHALELCVTTQLAGCTA